MASLDYIPSKDADFGPWLSNLAILTTATPAAYGLTAGDALAITGQSTAWNAAYTLATDPSTRTPAAVADKDAVRATAEATVRPLCMRVQTYAPITPEQLTSLGLTVRKTTPTPAGPILDVPALSLLQQTPMVVKLGFRSTATPTSKAKPPGTDSVQVFTAVGDTFAVDPTQASYAANWGKSPNSLTFSAPQIGKKLTVWARFMGTSGPGGEARFGPWSTPLTTTVV